MKSFTHFIDIIPEKENQCQIQDKGSVHKILLPTSKTWAAVLHACDKNGIPSILLCLKRDRFESLQMLHQADEISHRGKHSH